MSQSEVERFARDLKTDSALLAETRKGMMPLADAVAVAARRGYSFTLSGRRQGPVRLRARPGFVRRRSRAVQPPRRVGQVFFNQ